MLPNSRYPQRSPLPSPHRSPLPSPSRSPSLPFLPRSDRLPPKPATPPARPSRRPSALPPMCCLAEWTPGGAPEHTTFGLAYIVGIPTGGTKIMCAEHLFMEKTRVSTECYQAAASLPARIHCYTRLGPLVLRAQMRQLLARPSDSGLPRWEALTMFMSGPAPAKEKREVLGLWTKAEVFAMEHRELHRVVKLDGPCRCHFGTTRVDRLGAPIRHPGIN